MRRVYKEKEYVIYKTDYGYIVQNILMKDFAHTHLENFNDARRIVGLSINKKVPISLSRYMLISLLRVNKDEKYLKKVEDLLKNKHKKQPYVNTKKKAR